MSYTGLGPGPVRLDLDHAQMVQAQMYLGLVHAQMHLGLAQAQTHLGLAQAQTRLGLAQALALEWENT